MLYIDLHCYGRYIVGLRNRWTLLNVRSVNHVMSSLLTSLPPSTRNGTVFLHYSIGQKPISHYRCYPCTQALSFAACTCTNRTIKTWLVRYKTKSHFSLVVGPSPWKRRLLNWAITSYRDISFLPGFHSVIGAYSPSPRKRGPVYRLHRHKLVAKEPKFQQILL